MSTLKYFPIKWPRIHIHLRSYEDRKAVDSYSSKRRKAKQTFSKQSKMTDQMRMCGTIDGGKVDKSIKGYKKYHFGICMNYPIIQIFLVRKL